MTNEKSCFSPMVAIAAIVWIVVIVLLVLFIGKWGSGTEDWGERAIAGQAYTFSGDLTSARYIDYAKNVVTVGSDYKCSLITSTACWYDNATGKIKRTYMYNGQQRTGTYTDGCQYAVGKWRTNDYGCMGNDVVYCWKYCDSSDMSCDSGTGMCMGDEYPTTSTSGNVSTQTNITNTTTSSGGNNTNTTNWFFFFSSFSSIANHLKTNIMIIICSKI